MGVYNDMYKMGAMVIAMSDAMEILYAYAKEELLPSYLPSPEYREVSRLTARLSLRLRDLLPDDSWNTVEKDEDAAAQLHSCLLYTSPVERAWIFSSTRWCTFRKYT